MDEDNAGITILTEMKKVMHSLKKNIGCRYNTLNLTGPQGMLMHIVGKYKKIKISEISEMMGLSNSTVSGIVDRLEKQGLADRKRSDEDRRVVYVSLTPKCNEVFEQNFKTIRNNLEEIIEKSDPEEIQTIIKGLKLLNKLVEKNSENIFK